MTIEGKLGKHFVRVYWNNGQVDMHPLVRQLADDKIEEGQPLYAGPEGPIYTQNWYTDPSAFLTLMYHVLTKVTKVEGAPQQISVGLNPS